MSKRIIPAADLRADSEANGRAGGINFLPDRRKNHLDKTVRGNRLPWHGMALTGRVDDHALCAKQFNRIGGGVVDAHDQEIFVACKSVDQWPTLQSFVGGRGYVALQLRRANQIVFIMRATSGQHANCEQREQSHENYDILIAGHVKEKFFADKVQPRMPWS